MENVSPTNARKNLYALIKEVVETSTPIEIVNTKNADQSVVVIGKRDWDAVQETLYLDNVGVLDQIRSQANEESEELGIVDWDSM